MSEQINKKKTLTLVELQQILGENILKLSDENVTAEENAANITTAVTIFKGARSMISNMSVILRASECIAEGRLKDTSTINKLVGK